MAMITVALVLSSLLSFLLCDASTGPGCSPSARAGYANEWPKRLDYGIYWLGPNKTFAKGAAYPTPHYDPKRPTVLFFHGWQGGYGGTTHVCWRMGTQCVPCEGHVEIMDAWFQRGWNIGMFYWDQFADEKCVVDAEYKIWQPVKQPMRWVSNDCHGPNFVGKEEHHDYAGPGHSVSELCAENVRSVLQDYAGSEIRWIGESLGVQLAAKCAELVARSWSHAPPMKVVMLEPAFSHTGIVSKLFTCVAGTKVAKDRQFGLQAQQYTNLALRNLQRAGVFIELWSTCVGFLKFVIDSTPHIYYDVHIQYHPLWCRYPMGRVFKMNSRNTIACYHNSVVPLYFFSLSTPRKSPERSIVVRDLSVQCRVPTAASSIDESRQLKRNCNFGDGVPTYDQTHGQMTMDANDDKFSVSLERPQVHISSLSAKYEYEQSGKMQSSWFTGHVVAALVGCVLVMSSVAALVGGKKRFERSRRMVTLISCEAEAQRVTDEYEGELATFRVFNESLESLE